MFIAHLPAGYLLARRMGRGHPQRTALIATGLVASILPDTDLLWFHLVDQRQTPHHAYMFHWPLFWVAGAALAWGGARLLKWRSVEPFIWVALAAVLLHMALDSVAAEIGWFRPFSDHGLNLVQVPARYDWWVWSFVLHWTFLAELAIVLAAGVTTWTDSRKVHVGKVHNE